MNASSRLLQGLKVFSLACCIGPTSANAATALEPPQFGAPKVTIPEGTDSAGGPYRGPGAYPSSVVAANVQIEVVPGSTLGGEGSNDLKVRFPHSGPAAWTDARHNEGDIAFNIGPVEPDHPASYPPDEYLEWAPSDGMTTYAWTVDRRAGIGLAAVRVNGFDNGDFLPDGGPVGTQYGVAYFTQGFRSGVGYSPIDGVYGNGNESQDLVMGMVGPVDEASFPVAVAFFPYLEGWVGAQVTAEVGPNDEAVFAAASKGIGVQPGAVVWEEPGVVGVARVSLGAGRGPEDGMLFVAPANGSSQTLVAGAAVDAEAGVWRVTLREDDGGALAGQGRSEFGFLFVPWNAERLVGGRIDGASGAAVASSGEFGLTRTRAGEYRLALPGKTEADGCLILSNAGEDAFEPGLANAAFLSYQYDSEAGSFVIQSRDAFEDGSPLTDTDFYFAWVDFNEPLAPPGATANVTAPVIRIAVEGDVVSIIIPTQAGATYQVQHTAAFESEWQDLPNGKVIGTGQQETVTDEGVQGAQRFYRVQVDN